MHSLQYCKRYVSNLIHIPRRRKRKDLLAANKARAAAEAAAAAAKAKQDAKAICFNM